ncbi:response regulator [compost metagenome]
MSNSDIARLLCLSIKTVSTYKGRILVKMQLRNQADLVRYAIKHDLFDDEASSGK